MAMGTAATAMGRGVGWWWWGGVGGEGVAGDGGVWVKGRAAAPNGPAGGGGRRPGGGPRRAHDQPHGRPPPAGGGSGLLPDRRRWGTAGRTSTWVGGGRARGEGGSGAPVRFPVLHCFLLVLKAVGGADSPVVVGGVPTRRQTHQMRFQNCTTEHGSMMEKTAHKKTRSGPRHAQFVCTGTV